MLRIGAERQGQEPHRFATPLDELRAFRMGAGGLNREREEPLGPGASRCDEIPPDRFGSGCGNTLRCGQPRRDFNHDDPIGRRRQIPGIDEGCQTGEPLLGGSPLEDGGACLPPLGQLLLARQRRLCGSDRPGSHERHENNQAQAHFG